MPKCSRIRFEMNFFEMFLNRLILAVGSHIFALDFGDVVINALLDKKKGYLKNAE